MYPALRNLEGGHLDLKAELAAWLETLLSPERLARIERVLDQRTRKVTVVLEDLYNWQNASAALRSCEIFGLQEVHTIENRFEFRRNTHVDLGSSKWLELIRWAEPGGGNTRACLESLRSRGFRIVAASPHTPAMAPSELELDQPLALCFGTELEGLSPELLELADARVQLPMYGFTRSFNVSVSVALLLNEVIGRLHAGVSDWQLEAEERTQLRMQWMRKSITHQQALIQVWLEERGHPVDSIDPLPEDMPDRGRPRS